MKSTVEQLSDNERQALALFFGTDAFSAFKKLCQLEINGLARDALASRKIDELGNSRGQAEMAKKLPLIIGEIYKRSNKKS